MALKKRETEMMMKKISSMIGIIAPLFLIGCLDSKKSPTAIEDSRQNGRTNHTEPAVVFDFITEKPQAPDTIPIVPDSIFLRNEQMQSYLGSEAPLMKTASTPYIILYQAANYTGAQFVIHASRDYNALKFTQAGDWNDKVSSIRFFNGANAHFWGAHDFMGGGYTWNSDIPNLTQFGFNDQISSVSWDMPNTTNAHVHVATKEGDPGYTTLYYPLDYNRLPRWTGIGEFNNTISEIHLSRYGWTGGSNVALEVKFYHDDNWLGSSASYVSSNGLQSTVYSDLIGTSHNNKFSSMRWISP